MERSLRGCSGTAKISHHQMASRGKPVFFEIQAVFLPVFKRYLLLRDYLLDGSNHEYLFLGFGPTDYSTPKQMGADVPCRFFQSLQKIDPNLPKVMPRGWRAAKSDWAICNTGLEITAQLRQNSEETVKNAYATGSDTKQQEEMTDFFEHISSIVLDKGQLVADGVDLASGVCSAPGKPKPVVGNRRGYA